jgi:hypothetical protein
MEVFAPSAIVYTVLSKRAAGERIAPDLQAESSPVMASGHVV